MEFLYFLEGIRTPLFNTFFLLITHLGEETVFLALALCIFWCVSKRQGYFMLMTGFFGMIINQAMKISFKISRPWVQDPYLKVVDGAKLEATGYSFPSGHTQMAVGSFGVVAIEAKRRWLRITAIVIAVLVAFSRMYLGVHTPWDVLASVGIAVILLVVLEPLFSNEERYKKAMPYLLAAVVLLSVGYLIYSYFLYAADPEEINNIEGLKSGYMLLGCALGLIPVYILDSRVIKFKTEAKWYVQIIKLAVGLALTVALKELLKLALLPLMGVFYERALRYFIIVVFAGCVWPISFRLLEKIKIPALDNLFGKGKGTQTKTGKKSTRSAR